MRLGPATEAASPIVLSLVLVAAAGTLVAGFYVARSLSRQPDEVPDVGVLGDDAGDRILVVQGDEEADWTGLEIRTDRPARVSLGSEVGLLDGVLSPGSRFVPLANTSRAVSGGDSLRLCAVAQAGPMQVTLRTQGSHVVLFDQSMAVELCERPGNGPPSANLPDGTTAAPRGASDAKGAGNGRDRT